jgi:L-lactate dehydrogenase complex protein LldG
MNSRDAILRQLRRQFVASADLPDLIDGDWTRYENPTQQFVTMVRFAGGGCDVVDSMYEVGERLKRHDQFVSANRVLSLISPIPGTVDLEAAKDPHDFEDLDYVICQGQLAVAENGAIWLTEELVRHRACYFITQYLVLVIEAKQIVHNMHEAYQQIQVTEPGFGLFLAGPSKTADIEQSLVIGAHGCRELQVFVIDQASDRIER